jgi:hypothetical protein
MIVIVVSAAGILYWQLKKRPQVVNHIPSAMVGFLEARNLNAPDALRNWALWSEQAPTARSFEAINQSLTWLGKPQGFSATPSERAAALQLLIPEAGQEISQLTAMHEAALYGQNEQDHVTARKAAWQIRSLTVRKIIREIFHR